MAVVSVAPNPPRPTAGRGRADDAVSADPLFFRLFLACVLARLAIGSNILDSVISYSTDGGSVIEKIHPGSIGLIGLAIVAFPRVMSLTRNIYNPLALGCMALIAGTILVATIGAVTGQTLGIGYLVDAILIAPAAVIGIAYLSIDQRVTVLQAVYALLGVNAALTLGEVALQTHFFLYPYIEATFRPAALFGHPLLIGLIMASAIPGAFIAPFALPTRCALVAILMLAVVIAEARAATIAAAAALALSAVISGYSGLRSGRLSGVTFMVITIGAMTLVPLAIFIGMQLGFAERLQSGVADQSTEARIVIYRVFDILSPNEIMFGTDIGRATMLIREMLKLDYIESSLIMYVLQFGMIGAVPLVLCLIAFLVGLGVRAPLQIKLSLLVFAGVASSNNTLSSKSPALLFAAVLAFAGATIANAGLTTKQRPSTRDVAVRPSAS